MVAVNSLHFLTFNLAGATVKRISHNGRSYLVAPASLIVPGVLNGSDGALYYPPDETARNPGIWNGTPMVVYHPTFEGVPVAAQDPQYRDHVGKSTVGYLRNDRFAGGKRVAEAWFDEEHTRNYDRQLPSHAQILPRLNRNEPIELSTGLHVDRDETPGVCPRTGRPYDAVARNYRPDHLAVLPDQRGACSVSDGCGVVMNNQKVKNADDSEGRWVTLPNGVHVQVKDGEIVKGPAAVKEAMNKVEKQHSKTMDAHDKVAQAIEKYRQVKEKNDKARSSTQTGKSERDSGDHSKVQATVQVAARAVGGSKFLRSATSAAVVKSKQADSGGRRGHREAAKEHLAAAKTYLEAASRASTGGNSDGSKKYLAVATSHREAGEFHRDRARGYVHNRGRYGNPHDLVTGRLIPHGSGTGLGEVHAAAVEGHKNPSGRKNCKCGGSCDSCKKVENSNPEGCNQYKECSGESSPIPIGSKAKMGNQEVTVLGHVWEGSRAATPTHYTIRDSKGRKYDVGKNVIKNQLDQGSGKSQATTNGDDNMATATKLPASERQGLVDKIVANCQCEGGDTAIVNTLSDAALMQLNAMAEAAPEDDSSVIEEDANSPKGKFGKQPGKVPPQFAKNMSAQEWLEAAPPEIRSAVTNAVKIERNARTGLVARLVANVAPEKKATTEKFLSNKSLDELEMMVDMIPTPVSNQGADDLFAPIFLGSAGGSEGRPVNRIREQDGFVANADAEMDPQFHLRAAAAK